MAAIVEKYDPGTLQFDIEPGRNQVKMTLKRVADNSKVWSVTIRSEAAEELGMLLVRAALWGNGPDLIALGSA